MKENNIQEQQQQENQNKVDNLFQLKTSNTNQKKASLKQNIIALIYILVQYCNLVFSITIFLELITKKIQEEYNNTTGELREWQLIFVVNLILLLFERYSAFQYLVSLKNYCNQLLLHNDPTDQWKSPLPINQPTVNQHQQMQKKIHKKKDYEDDIQYSSDDNVEFKKKFGIKNNKNQKKQNQNQNQSQDIGSSQLKKEQLSGSISYAIQSQKLMTQNDETKISAGFYIMTILQCLFFFDYTLLQIYKAKHMYDKSNVPMKIYNRKQTIEVYCFNIIFCILSMQIIMQYIYQNNEEEIDLMFMLSFVSNILLTTYKIYEGYVQRVKQLEEVELKLHQPFFQFLSLRTQIFITDPFKLSYLKQISPQFYKQTSILRRQRKNNLNFGQDFNVLKKIYTFFFIGIYVFTGITMLVFSNLSSYGVNVYTFLVYGLIAYSPQIAMYLKVIFWSEKSYRIGIKYKIKKALKILFLFPILSFFGFSQYLLPIKTDNIPLVKQVKETWVVHVLPSSYHILIRCVSYNFWLYLSYSIIFQDNKFIQNSNVPESYYDNLRNLESSSMLYIYFYISLICLSILMLMHILQISVYLVYSHSPIGNIDKNKKSSTLEMQVEQNTNAPLNKNQKLAELNKTNDGKITLKKNIYQDNNSTSQNDLQNSEEIPQATAQNQQQQQPISNQNKNKPSLPKIDESQRDKQHSNASQSNELDFSPSASSRKFLNIKENKYPQKLISVNDLQQENQESIQDNNQENNQENNIGMNDFYRKNITKLEPKKGPDSIMQSQLLMSQNLAQSENFQQIHEFDKRSNRQNNGNQQNKQNKKNNLSSSLLQQSLLQSQKLGQNKKKNSQDQNSQKQFSYGSYAQNQMIGSCMSIAESENFRNIQEFDNSKNNLQPIQNQGYFLDQRHANSEEESIGQQIITQNDNMNNIIEEEDDEQDFHNSQTKKKKSSKFSKQN